eukprot:4812190-Amphidinium_carterae.1
MPGFVGFWGSPRGRPSGRSHCRVWHTPRCLLSEAIEELRNCSGIDGFLIPPCFRSFWLKTDADADDDDDDDDGDDGLNV